VLDFRSSFIADGAPGFGEAAAGDHLQTVYRFWLSGHQLFDGGAPWRDPYSFQPLVEPQVALGGWPFGVPFYPLDALAGPVVAWNTLLLAGIVAAGLLTYAWLRCLQLQEVPAALGGLAFAIAPYRLEQSGGHLLGWIAVLIPLALLACERSRSAHSARRAHWWGALAAVALVSIPLSGQLHLALGAIPFALAYAAVRFGPVTFGWVLAGALAATGIGLAIRYTLIAGSIEAGGRSLDEVRMFEADWLDLLSRWERNGSEQFVYLGWLTPALALLGLVLLRRRRSLAIVLGLAVLVPALLAVGTHLPTYSLLWDALPPFRFPRVPERLLPIANLALAALAAVGAARILALRRAPVVAAVLVALVAADLAVQPLRASPADPGNAAYGEGLQRVPGRTLELPLFEPGIHYGSVYNYYTLQGRRERPGGYSTLAPPIAFDFFFRLNRLSCGVWLDGDAEELESLGIGPVIFHEGLYRQSRTPGAWFAWQALRREGYRPIEQAGAVTLLGPGSGPVAPAPVPEPSRSQIVFCEGWRERVMEEREAPFWVWGEGRRELVLSSPSATWATIWVDGERARTLRVERTTSASIELPGAGWHAVVLELPRLLATQPPRGLRLERLGAS
jgi:hypothetical protein